MTFNIKPIKKSINIIKKMENPKSNKKEYILSENKKYWCYICKHSFNKIYIEDQPIECIYCHNEMCEEILNKPYLNNDISPENFTPYSPNENDQNNNQEPIIIPINNENSSLIDFILNLLEMEYEDEEIEDILNYIMNNDPNKYGSPPASKSEIEKLNKYTLTKEKLKSFGNENLCSVCKEELNIGDKLIDLPCNHYFHIDCLMPWLSQHDSCPVCRFELKTDDEDYENMKKERNRNLVYENQNNFLLSQSYNRNNSSNNNLNCIPTNNLNSSGVVNEVNQLNTHIQS